MVYYIHLTLWIGHNTVCMPLLIPNANYRLSMNLLPAITPLLDKLVTSTVVDNKKPSNTGSQVGSVVLLRILDDTQKVIERAAATSGGECMVWCCMVLSGHYGMFSSDSIEKSPVSVILLLVEYHKCANTHVNALSWWWQHITERRNVAWAGYIHTHWPWRACGHQRWILLLVQIIKANSNCRL